MFFKSDPLPKTADFIALISFGAASPDRLTNGSRETMMIARKLLDRYPDALVFGGTFFLSPKYDIEKEEKERVLGQRFVWVGPVSSTTDERVKIVEFARRKVQLDSIVIVDESYHSIRTRIVWEHYQPNTRFSFQLVPGRLAADPENPMPLQRSATKWLIANLLFAPFYKWWPGVEWFAKRNFNQKFKCFRQ